MSVDYSIQKLTVQVSIMTMNSVNHTVHYKNQFLQNLQNKALQLESKILKQVVDN